MMRSELISWPVTLAILVLAFGSLVAAGLPLMLTIVGLVAAAGSLWIGTRIADISIWSMNFALMFALALGIDYALFDRATASAAPCADRRCRPAEAVGRDDGHRRQGRALLGPDGADLAERRDARAEPGLPVDEPRHHAVGRLRPGGDADPAAGGAGQARPAGRTASRSPGSARASTARRARRPGPSACGAGRCPTAWRRSRCSWCSRCRCSRCRPGCRRSRSSRRATHSRAGYAAIQRAFGPGATGPLQIVAPTGRGRTGGGGGAARPGHRARDAAPRAGRDGMTLVQAIPTTDPSARATGATIDRLRAALPPAALVGGPVAENHDLEAALSARTPLVIGVVLGLSFLLLVVALQAPLIAALARRHEPAGHRGRLRRREVDLPGRPRARGARIRAPGVPGRVGTRVLLRDDLRDLDGLHRVPARRGEGALGPLGRRRPARPWSAAWPNRDA